jgi:hypothetical protein
MPGCLLISTSPPRVLSHSWLRGVQPMFCTRRAAGLTQGRDGTAAGGRACACEPRLLSSHRRCLPAQLPHTSAAPSPPQPSPVVWQPVLLAWRPGHEKVAARADGHVVAVGAAGDVAEAALVVRRTRDACVVCVGGG